MSPLKTTYAEQIEVKRDGTIQVRFAKQRLNLDGTPDGEPQWHRTILEPDTDIIAQMVAVNMHLIQMGESPVGSEDISRIQSHAAIARTPENVAACVERKAEIQREQELRNKQAEEAEAKRVAEEQARFNEAVAKSVAALTTNTSVAAVESTTKVG